MLMGYTRLTVSIMMYGQGLIEPPKAARGHATRADGEIQHVTKFKFT